MTRVRIHVSPAYRYLCRTKLANGTIATEACLHDPDRGKAIGATESSFLHSLLTRRRD